MPLIVWSEKFSVGVKSVDDQHTVLFNTINDLHAAMMTGQARTKLGELLRRLLTYTENHFRNEEKLMEAAKYAGLAQHQALHRDLTRQVETYIARHEKGEISLSVELAGFLSDWLTNHIQKVDQLYSPCLTRQGVR